jgi:hypothetical protein
MGRWYLGAVLAGTLVIGIYTFFDGGWTTHLPDGTAEDCLAGAHEPGIDTSTASVGGEDRGGFHAGLRCQVNRTSFFIPASADDYAGLIFWAVALGGLAALLLMACVHPVLIGVRRVRRRTA